MKVLTIVEVNHPEAYCIWILRLHPNSEWSDLIAERGASHELLEPLTSFDDSNGNIIPITSQSQCFGAVFLKVS